jgi:hypothetical protein
MVIDFLLFWWWIFGVFNFKNSTVSDCFQSSDDVVLWQVPKTNHTTYKPSCNGGVGISVACSLYNPGYLLTIHSRIKTLLLSFCEIYQHS